MADDHLVLPKRAVLGIGISLGRFEQQVDAVMAMASQARSSYVCCVNAHMTVEAWRDPAFARIVNDADLATPDGMPVLRSLQLFHRNRQERVAGNDLMPALLDRAAAAGLGVFLFGGTKEVLDRIAQRSAQELPRLRIVGSISPPFRTLNAEEMRHYVDLINSSGARIVLVSLGCPKQEKWMADMRGNIGSVMVGVGGAFLLYAGIDKRAPKWMRDLSLEWAYRFWLEPGRLWRRYLVTNTLFIGLFLRECFRRLRGASR